MSSRITETPSTGEPAAGRDFLREIVAADVAAGRNGGRVVTRFPPEPNGYLHIGHAKAFLLDFGVAEEFGGKCNLRFDDTNPEKEDVEYVDAQRDDLKWMGCDWGDREFFASDYYDRLYDWAVTLVKQGKAYVDDLSQEEMRAHRGTPTEQGKNSPYRDRGVEENLALLERMKRGEFAEGACVLRAKIDMAHPNLVMRDPTMYRIRKVRHHRTGDKWCIYPMYDFAHCLSDAIEGVTHSLCDIGYVNNRELYDWFIQNVPAPAQPHQYEFARLNITYMVMSKRLLKQLVDEGHVGGWDDPRMPTLRGLRRRGYTASALRAFIRSVGVSRVPSTVDIRMLEHTIREELNRTAPRAMAVLEPLKVVLVNYPEGKVEQVEAENNPEDPSAGNRLVPFGRELYIERDDFREVPPPKWFRLSPGAEIRLKHAYYIRCVEAIKDAGGNVVELRCTYDPESRGGGTPDGRKVKGTSHWVSAAHAMPAEVRLYEHLFATESPQDAEDGEDEGATFLDRINLESLKVLTGCMVEPGLRAAAPETRVQFLRQGYYVVDKDTDARRLVFNRVVGLKDSWSRIEARG
jgi:glutaminyl-tRNA synthetase